MALDVHPDLLKARDPTTAADVLTRLAAAVIDRTAATPRTPYEIALRAAIASNANTPPALLAKLASEHTTEVVHNPALLFVLVENPNALTTVFKYALQALLGHPDAPVDWLLHAARDKEPWARRLAARSRRTPAHALRALMDDADHWVVLDLAANPALPAHLLEALAQREPPPGKGASPVRRIVAANPSAPLHTLEHLAETDNLLAVVAANPQLPTYLFDVLVEHEEPLVRAALATQPRLPPRLQRKLLLDASHLVRSALARSSTDPDILDRLSLSRELSVRKAVIGNASTPTSLLERLLYSPTAPHRLAAEAALKARGVTRRSPLSPDQHPDSR